MNRIIRVNQQRIARLERAPVIGSAHVGLKGRYKLDAMRPDGRIRPLTGWFDNLITNFGLNYIGDSGYAYGNCYVGSGNTAPANTDTQLVSLVAGGATEISSTGTSQASAPYYGTRTNVYQFAQGAAAGNLSEVGVGPSATGLFSRALILDSGGSPTTITVLSDEFLNVTYQVQLYPVIADTTGTVSIGGLTYNYVARPSSVTAANWTPYINGDIMAINNMQVYDGTIGAVTTGPSGTSAQPNALTRSSYSQNSLINTAVGTWSLTSANFTLPGGVKSLAWSVGPNANSFGAYQVSFDNGGNGIPKDASSVLTLTAKIAWGRGTS